jgi:predicted DNA-binding transcriptional regulator YafY
MTSMSILRVLLVSSDLMEASWCLCGCGSDTQTPYVKTKPLHRSQKLKLNDDDSATLTIEVIPNYELEQMILHFGEKYRVLEPEGLRERILSRWKLGLEAY